MPLFVLMAGSPFFLKNFLHTLGHFDICGCAFAICLLLAPARSVAFVVLGHACGDGLILIHHIHFLMYVPTIAVIVVLRYYLVQGVTPKCDRRRRRGVRRRSTFPCHAVQGNILVPAPEFVAHVQSRMADPLQKAEVCCLLFLHLVSAAFPGNPRYLGSHAVQPPRGPGVCAADLAACAVMAVF